MRIPYKIATTLVTIFLLNFLTSTAQEYLKFESSKNIKLIKESKELIIKFKVGEEYNFLTTNVNGYFSNGKILIELINPKGEKKGYFTIKTDSNTYGLVTGKMEKSYRNPEIGEWALRIVPTKATGRINIKNTLIYNQRINILELDQISKDTESKIRQ